MSKLWFGKTTDNGKPADNLVQAWMQENNIIIGQEFKIRCNPKDPELLILETFQNTTFFINSRYALRQVSKDHQGDSNSIMYKLLAEKYLVASVTRQPVVGTLVVAKETKRLGLVIDLLPLWPDPYNILVEHFEEFPEGNNGNGKSGVRGAERRCYWYRISEIAPVGLHYLVENADAITEYEAHTEGTAVVGTITYSKEIQDKFDACKCLMKTHKFIKQGIAAERMADAMAASIGLLGYDFLTAHDSISFECPITDVMKDTLFGENLKKKEDDDMTARTTKLGITSTFHDGEKWVTDTNSYYVSNMETSHLINTLTLFIKQPEKILHILLNDIEKISFATAPYATPKYLAEMLPEIKQQILYKVTSLNTEQLVLIFCRSTIAGRMRHELYNRNVNVPQTIDNAFRQSGLQLTYAKDVSHNRPRRAGVLEWDFWSKLEITIPETPNWNAIMKHTGKSNQYWTRNKEYIVQSGYIIDDQCNTHGPYADASTLCDALGNQMLVVTSEITYGEMTVEKRPFKYKGNGIFFA